MSDQLNTQPVLESFPAYLFFLMTSFANIDNSCFFTLLSTVLLYSFMMVPTRSGYEGGGGSESNLEEVHVSVERVQFLVNVLYCLIRLKQQMWLFFNALVGMDGVLPNYFWSYV